MIAASGAGGSAAAIRAATAGHIRDSLAKYLEWARGIEAQLALPGPEKITRFDAQLLSELDTVEEAFVKMKMQLAELEGR